MSLGEYLFGALQLGVTLGAAGWATWLVVSRRMPGSGGVVRVAALGLVACGVVVAVYALPAALGVLSRLTVPLTAVLVALAAWRIPPARDEAPTAPPPAPPSSAVSWGIAAAGALVAAGWVLALMLDQYPGPPLHTDIVTFHLPLVAHWIDSSSLWHVEDFVPDKAPGYYPANGDIPLLAAVLPWRNEFLTYTVNLPLLALLGVGLHATARELGAASAHALLFAAVVVAMPAVAIVGVLGLADTFLLATFACGVLFLLRHARLGHTTDLVLGGLGLGLAMGSKWYGLTALVVAFAVWVLAWIVARRPWRSLASNGAILAGVAVAAGGIWLLRNLIESGDPFFPVDVSPFGVAIFPAPHDFEREVFGFTLADYLGERDTWRRAILPGLRGTLGASALVVAAGGAVAAVVALRSRPRAGRVLAMLAAAALIAAAYVVTPYSAQGFAGAPDAAPNARYVVPALVLLAPVTAWAATRAARLGLVLQAAGLLGVLYAVAGTDVYQVPIEGRSIAVAAVAVAAAVALGLLVWRARLRPGRPALALAAGAAVAFIAAAGYAEQRKFDDRRYAGVEPAIDWILAHAPADHRIGLAGLGYNPVIYPAFGPRLENQVHYVGPTIDGMLRPYTRERPLLAAIRRGGYDLMIVQRQGWVRRALPAKHEAWLRRAGWRVVADSEGVALYAPAEGAAAGVRR